MVWDLCLLLRDSGNGGHETILYIYYCSCMDFVEEFFIGFQ